MLACDTTLFRLISLSATDNFKVITLDYLKKRKHNAITGDIGYFDIEIDIACLGNLEGITVMNFKLQVDRFLFLDDHEVIVLVLGRWLNLVCATGNPSFVMLCSFTDQVLAQLGIQTGVLIETLAALGAKVRWASRNNFSTQDHATAAIAKANTSAAFAWKGETSAEYWSRTEQRKEFEEKVAKDGGLPDPSISSYLEFKYVSSDIERLHPGGQIEVDSHGSAMQRCQ